ncbi:hypothetical protein EXU48_08325 [Occultella glacieicola]|uniref:Secreted protein n=1 Tax=Occultella glacieicola TaxID=2518684 RepID=A0ABY2E5B2_9MICO|nr:hypothetical protein [Occultella glacieicola]TDE94794.1 hypothetical protein EXU48_08325 [Occultella glacieicola]
MRRTRTVVVAAFLFGALLGLSGCGVEEPVDDPPSGTTEPTGSEEPTDDDTDDPGDDVDPAVSAAVDDLAERLDVAADDIEAGSLESVTWRDGAIGCPVPDQAYTQALVEGRRLILTSGGEEYAYHGAGEDPLVYCETPEEPFEVDAAS